MDTPTDFRPGSWIYPTKPKHLESLGMPNPREWSPTDDDWQLPDNWQQIIHEGFKERLKKYRSFQIFMDTCVRCGACADKCHFFIGGGDPKNMPVLRAELLRSIYRNDFTTVGRILGKFAGGRKLTVDVIKEWFYYFYQCTECRRCSVFCPYGIDTAEITMMARELLHLLGLGVNWVMEPVANCSRTGNHLGIQPHGLKDTLEFFCEDIEEITGIHIDPPINKKGADILFVTPSGDFLAEPGTFTCMGYMMLFHELGLNYTFSTYASDGGNFGLFTSAEAMKKLNAKNSTKMVHIAEFTADLIKHGKLKLDPSMNDNVRLTYHDSCNPARAMGLFDEPRYVIENICNNFFEMPENTIREQTFCCGGGAGLGTDENMEMRLRGGLPRGNAVRHVRDKYDVNQLACMCAIDRATLTTVCDYWAPGVQVTGLHELVANALVMKGQKERTMNLRLEPLAQAEPAMAGKEDGDA